MMVCSTIQERDAAPNAVLTANNPDGTYTVYQVGDEIPAPLADAAGISPDVE